MTFTLSAMGLDVSPSVTRFLLGPSGYPIVPPPPGVTADDRLGIAEALCSEPAWYFRVPTPGEHISESNFIDGRPTSLRHAVASGWAYLATMRADWVCVDSDVPGHRAFVAFVSALSDAGKPFLLCDSGNPIREGRHVFLTVNDEELHVLEALLRQLRPRGETDVHSMVDVLRVHFRCRPPLTPHRLGGWSMPINLTVAEAVEFVQQHSLQVSNLLDIA
jgi:hypothetical protein